MRRALETLNGGDCLACAVLPDVRDDQRQAASAQDEQPEEEKGSSHSEGVEQKGDDDEGEAENQRQAFAP